MFPLDPGAFLVDGRPVTLVRPRRRHRRRPACRRPAPVAVTGLRARTARAARIWVEGIHDAALVERVWGHDLRVEGIVVEPIDGLDNLPGAVAAIPARRRSRGSGVLADHLVPGIEGDPDRRRRCHGRRTSWSPATRTSTSGRRSGPRRSASRPGRGAPRGSDWKTGVCAALGISDTAAMWGRVNGAVRSYRDLATPLITAVERLIDFVTAEPDARLSRQGCRRVERRGTSRPEHSPLPSRGGRTG